MCNRVSIYIITPGVSHNYVSINIGFILFRIVCQLREYRNEYAGYWCGGFVSPIDHGVLSWIVEFSGLHRCSDWNAFRSRGHFSTYTFHHDLDRKWIVDIRIVQITIAFIH